MPKPRKWSSARRARVLSDRRKTNAVRLADAILTAQRDNPRIKVKVDRDTLIGMVETAMQKGEAAAVQKFVRGLSPAQ